MIALARALYYNGRGDQGGWSERFQSLHTANPKLKAVRKSLQSSDKIPTKFRQRAMSKQAKHLYEFGRFRLDATERVLLRDGEPVALTPKAIETLIVLVESSGHIVEKDELMKAVWPDTFVGEDSLTRNVSVLRRVLGEDSANAAYIETLPKRGYRFTASVQERWDGQADLVVERHARLRITQEDLNHQNETGQSFAREATAAGEIAGPLQRRLSRALPVVAIALVGVIAALAYLWVARRSQPVESAAQVSSLAVLPFKSLSADGGDEYLGLGIADALILKLGSAQRLVVRPVRAVLKYGGSEQDPLAAGRDLQVEAILDGSIQKTGDHIRVTARLLRVSDGAQLWAEKFDENTTDIFRIQDSISEKASGALALKLIGRERNPYHTENREAYELYLRGRYFWNRRTEGEKILKYFSQAIEKDPNYAPAYAGLADYYAKFAESDRKSVV